MVLAHALPRTWGQPCGVRQSAPRSYDSLARGGSLHPHTAGGRGKYGGTSYKKRSEIHEKHIVRVRYKDCPDKVSVMANVRGILLNSYKRDNIAAEDRV